MYSAHAYPVDLSAGSILQATVSPLSPSVTFGLDRQFGEQLVANGAMGGRTERINPATNGVVPLSISGAASLVSLNEAVDQGSYSVSLQASANVDPVVAPDWRLATADVSGNSYLHAQTDAFATIRLHAETFLDDSAPMIPPGSTAPYSSASAARVVSLGGSIGGPELGGASSDHLLYLTVPNHSTRLAEVYARTFAGAYSPSESPASQISTVDVNLFWDVVELTPKLGLLDPTGTLVATGSSALDYQASTSGTYRLVVSEGDDFNFDGHSDSSGEEIIGAYRLTFESLVGTLAATLDPSGNLTITDADAAGKDNVLSVRVNGGNLVIEDVAEAFQSAPAGGALSNGNRTLTIPLASVGGILAFETAGGNDSLTVDLAAGDTIPAGGLQFHGGDANFGPGDTLVITGGDQGQVTYNYTTAHGGSIAISHFGSVVFTGLEPIINSGSATDIVFNLPMGPNSVTLDDDGTGGNGLSRLSGATIESIDFAGPAGSITINRGSASDTITVQSLPDMKAGMAIGTAENPFRASTLAGAVALTAGRHLSLSATDVIVSAAGNMTTDGGGMITLRADDVGIDASAALSAGTAAVTIAPLTPGRAINLGTNAIGQLGLSDVELDRISAGSLQIGSSTAGTITISQPISPASTPSVSLIAQGSVVDDSLLGIDLAVANLILDVASVGTISNRLETTVTQLHVVSRSGGVFLGDSDGMTVSSASATGGAILLWAQGPLSLSGDMTAAGSANDVTLLSTGSSSRIDLAADQVIRGASVSLTADRMDLAGSVLATSGFVQLATSSSGWGIDLGSATDTAANTLELSDAELDGITTGGVNRPLTVYSRASLRISSPIRWTGSSWLSLLAEGSLVDGNTPLTDVTATRLSVDAASVGTSENRLETSVTQLDAVSRSGGIFVSDSDGLTVSGASAKGGGISFVAHGPLSLAGNVTTNSTTNDVGLHSIGDSSSISVAAANLVSGRSVTLQADRMNLAGSVQSTSGPVHLYAVSPDWKIDLGSPADVAASTLELSDAELDRIATAGPIVISSQAGVTISSAISPPGVGVIRTQSLATPPVASSGELVLVTNSVTTSTADVFPDGISLDVSASSTIDLSGWRQTVSSLLGEGDVDLGSGILRVGDNSMSPTIFWGSIRGSGSVIKRGSGSVILGGTNSYTGKTSLAEGTLLVVGTLASPVTVSSIATLSGNGVVAERVSVEGGNLSPGSSSEKNDARTQLRRTGVLSTGDLSLDGKSRYAVELEGHKPGAFDAVQVTGTLSLDGGRLDIFAPTGFVPSAGNRFQILSNDGSDPVSGPGFDGLPEGAVISTDFLGSGLSAWITYVGGDGNDVVIEVAEPPHVTFDMAETVQDETGGTVTIWVRLDKPLDEALSLSLLASGTASMNDYSAPQQLFFPAGSTAASFDVTIVDDARDEEDEALLLSLGDHPLVRGGDIPVHTLTIRDNDLPPVVTFGSLAQTISEGAAQAVNVQLRLSAASGREVTIPLTAGGTATSPGDYVLLSSPTVQIPAGATSAWVSLQLADDTAPESSETVTLTMVLPSHATLPAPTMQSHVIQIVDNDLPTVTFALSAQDALEKVSPAPVLLTALLSFPSVLPITVPIIYAGTATSGVDYVAGESTITFQPGETSKSVLIATPINDSLAENMEKIEVKMGAPTNALLGADTTHVVNLVDDDRPWVYFSTPAQELFESAGGTNLTVKLSGPAAYDVYVTLRRQTTNADPTRDFQDNLIPSQQGYIQQLKIPAGQTERSWPVSLTNDANNEATEYVQYVLAGPVGASLYTGTKLASTYPISHKLNIKDNDPLVSISSTSANTVNEGTSGSIVVSLSAPTDHEVTIPFTVSGTAAAKGYRNFSGYVPPDYSIVTGLNPLKITAGNTSRVIGIAANDDSNYEGNETVTVKLGTPTGAIASKPTTHVLTIVDNDFPTVFFASSSSTYEEKEGTNSIEVKLSAPYPEDVIVYFAFSNVTAGTRHDYKASPTSVKFPKDSGLTRVFLNVPIKDDTFDEPNETFRVRMTSAINARLGSTTTHTVTITDNDLPPPPPPPPSTTPSAATTSPSVSWWYECYPGQACIPMAVNGYLAGSTMFFDANRNSILDFLDRNGDGVQGPDEPAEPSAATDIHGFARMQIPEVFDLDRSGRFEAVEGELAAVGGQHTTTRQSFTGVLRAPAGVSVLTPATTLAAELVRSHGFAVDDALHRVRTALGLPEVDLTRIDPPEAAVAGDADGLAVYATSAKLYDTMVQAAGFVSGHAGAPSAEYLQQAIVAAVAARIVHPDAVLDLSDAAIVQSLLAGSLTSFGVAMDPDLTAAAAAVIAESNAYLDSLELEDAPEGAVQIAKTQVVALAAAKQLAEAAGGQRAMHDVVAQYTGTELANQIDVAVYGDIVPPRIVTSDVRQVESNAGQTAIEFMVALDRPSVDPIHVAYRTLDGTAVSGDGDYEAVSGTLSWEPGDTTSRTIRVNVFGDSLFEFDETFSILLVPDGRPLNAQPFVTGTIVNDDALVYETPSDGVANFLQLFGDGSELVLLRNDETVLSGELSTPVPITIRGAADVENHLIVELTAYASTLAGGLLFEGGTLASDSLLVHDDWADAVERRVSDGQSGEFSLGSAVIQYRAVETARDFVTPDVFPKTTDADEGSVYSLYSGTYDAEEALLYDYLWTVTKDGVEFASGSDPTFSFAPNDNGLFETTLTISAAGRANGSTRFLIPVRNLPPTVNAGADIAELNEGTVHVFAASITDPGSADTHLIVWDFGDGHRIEGTLTPGHAYSDNGDFEVTVTVTDDDGGQNTDTMRVSVRNVPPVLDTIELPSVPQPVDTEVSVVVPFSDAGFLDTHTAVWDWGDGTTSAGVVSWNLGGGTVAGSHIYGEPGIYTLSIQLLDDEGAVAVATHKYLVIYDATAGRVKGSGWFHSLPGSYPADPSLSGKARFELNAKYQPGATAPVGNTEFHLNRSSLDFASSSYEWLVVSGAKATVQGAGSLNGKGGYGFRLTAWDGERNGCGGRDKIRIVIWDRNQGNRIIYDNDLGAGEQDAPTTRIGGGAVVIHGALAAQNSVPGVLTSLSTFPSQNPALIADAISPTESIDLPSRHAVGVHPSLAGIASMSSRALGPAAADAIWADRGAGGLDWLVDPTTEETHESPRLPGEASDEVVRAESIAASVHRTELELVDASAVDQLFEPLGDQPSGGKK